MLTLSLLLAAPIVSISKSFVSFFSSYSIHRIFKKTDLQPRSVGHWDSNLSKIFSRYTYGVTLKLLYHFFLESSYSQIWVSTLLAHPPGWWQQNPISLFTLIRYWMEASNILNKVTYASTQSFFYYFIHRQISLADKIYRSQLVLFI